MTLEVSDPGEGGASTGTGIGELKDDELEACIDDVPPTDPEEIIVEASAICDEVQTGTKKDATWTFDVKVPKRDGRATYEYVFNTEMSLDEGYGKLGDIEISGVVGGGVEDVIYAKGSGNLEGTFQVTPGVTEFKATLKVKNENGFKAGDSVTLEVSDPGVGGASSGSDSGVLEAETLEGCGEPPVNSGTKSDVALYLVLDNSTSMLLPDPSTKAIKPPNNNRLEAQDRVALFAFEEAIAEAGYGFSRGEDSVLSSEEFRQALIDNSTESLSTALDEFDVIVNPDFQGEAQAVTVHLITYGYAVEYGALSFNPSSVKDAINLAKTILDVKTPDQIFGNSINDNSTWIERDLPLPDENDLYWDESRPSSNLYSGTEMLGALKGLEHLLNVQAKTPGAADLTTLVTMVTDGRPERRAWWDTRTSQGSDSLTGVPVSLPEDLGGDPITSSGLIYDMGGKPTYLENNAGRKEWKQMQKKLNKALDVIATKNNNPADQALQVEVMAMGDDTSDADFPAIYADLFSERTFDNSSGGWSYEVFTSLKDLPDLVG